MTRVGWFLLILGASLGFILGLYYTWQVNPAQRPFASPGDLSQEFQDQYRTLTALAYESNGDMKRALRRLESLEGSDPAQSLGALSQQLLAESRSAEEVSAVARLAADLAELSTPRASTADAQRSLNQTASAPTRSPKAATPTASAHPPPTSTYTSTPSPFYRLKTMRKICDPDLSPPLIQVNVLDAAGDPVAAVGVLIIWDAGEDHFFTGLKPELGLGYADFAMSVGTLYRLQLFQSSDPVSGLQSEICQKTGGESFPGSWLLVFQAP